jgi:hypothetical protein
MDGGGGWVNEYKESVLVMHGSKFFVCTDIFQ